MLNNNEIVARFYTAFSKLNAAEMLDCYEADILYNDPIFGLLQADKVHAMWQMICNNASNMSCNFGNIQQVDDEYITCNWKTSYFFKPLNKRVVYDAKAYMKIVNGKITEHSDGYRLSTWIRKTYGFPGMLLGWSGFMQKKVQKRYRLQLKDNL